MQRYRVRSRADAAVREAWDAYLARHVPEVVLRGGFAGACVTDDDGARVADYLAPGGVLARYLTGPGPALRAEAEAKFPSGIERLRETVEVRAQVSPAFAWASLGLVNIAGGSVPCPTDGPFTLAVFAPWCEEAREAWPRLVEGVEASGARGALVSVLAPAEDVRTFAREHPVAPPVWLEPSAKDDAGRLRSAHAWLRQLAGDDRRWGVPAVRQLYVESNRFVVITP